MRPRRTIAVLVALTMVVGLAPAPVPTPPAAAQTDNTPPTVQGVTVNGDQLVITFDETLTANTPAKQRFLLTINNTSYNHGRTQGAVASGTTVTVTLTQAVDTGDHVTLQYLAGGTTTEILDAAGNAAAAFTWDTVINNTPATAPAGCGDPQSTFSSLVSLSSTDTTITFSFSQFFGSSGTTNVEICNAAGTVTTVLSIPTGSGKGPFTISKLGTADDSPALTPGTDYWVRGLAYETNSHPWLHIRTTGTAPAGDTTAPMFESASVNGASLVITFDEDLAAAANLANSAFGVKKTPAGSSAEEAVTLSSTAPAIDAKTVTLTLANAVASGDTGVKVSYTKPTSGTNNKLADATGNETASFTDQTVTNDTPQPVPTVPAGCGTATHTDTNGIASVSSADNSITVNWRSGNQGPHEGTVDIQLCNSAGTVVNVQRDPPLGGTSTYTRFGTGATAPLLTSGTDYWVRWTAYSNHRPWVHVRTTGNPPAPAANNAATGVPTVSGFAQVGNTLTAATAGIADADGLTGVSFGYQWVRVDGTTETNIASATSATYTLVAADSGKTVKVKVTFRDDLGNNEAATSAATGTVVAAAPACEEGNAWCATLTVGPKPGNKARGYCANYGVICPSGSPYGSLSDTSLTLGGADYTVLSVRWGLGMGSPGTRLHWSVNNHGLDEEPFAAARLANMTLKVDSHTFALSSATQENDSGDVPGNYRWTNSPAAIRAYAVGRKVTVQLLDTTPTVTISGGSAVTEGTAAQFTLTADPAPSADLTVNVTVTEAAGSDFVASGDEGAKTVTIASGTTSKTYAVTTQADTTDEPNGSVTVAITASGAYDTGTAGSASVTVNDDDGAAATAPVKPAAPTVSTSDGTQITVSWTAPSTGGSAITGYGVQYRRTNVPGTTEDAAWVDLDPAHSGTATTATVTGLVQGASYQARVRATNAVGNSDWSDAGSGHTGPARLVSATTSKDGNIITITFTKTMPARVYNAGNFIAHVTRSGVLTSTLATTAQALTGVLGLRLPAGTIQPGDAVKVAYSWISGTRLQDADSAQVAETTTEASQWPVTNAVSDAPSPSKAVLTGASLAITFDEALASTVPVSGAFTVKLTVGDADPVTQSLAASNAVAISGSTLTLTLASAPGAGAVTVSYDKTAAGSDPNGPLQDSDGDETASFTDYAVLRPAVATGAATSTDGLTVTVTFDKNIKTVGDAANFTVTVGTNNRVPTGASLRAGDAAKVDLTLSAAHRVLHGDTATVSYGKGAGANLTDTDDLAVANFSGVAVTNNLPAPARVTGVEIVSFPGADQTYQFGDKILVQVTFSEAVTVDTTGGTPRLTIRFDTGVKPDKFPAYESGTGTTKLVFGIEIDGRGNSGQGVLVIANSLTANSGSITSTATGAAANLAHDGLGQDTGHKVNGAVDRDTAAPVFSSATVNGATLAITFDEAIDATAAATPAAGDFGVTVNGAGRAVATGGVSISGAVVTLTLASATTAADTAVTVSYTKPTGTDAKPLRDHTAGNEAAGFAAQIVDNQLDVTAPGFSSARVSADRTKVVITFTEGLAAAANLANGAFTVKRTPQGGTPTAATLTGSPSISGATVTLTLTTAILATDTGVTVSYTKPASGTANKLADVNGNEVADFTDETVTVADTTAPQPQSASVKHAVITIVFDEPLDGGSVPAIGQFAVTATDNTVLPLAAGGVSVAGSTVTLTLAAPRPPGETVMGRVVYTQPASGGLRDAANNRVVTFTSASVANVTPPSLLRATAEGTALMLVFNHPLAAAASLANGAFAVKKTPQGGAEQNVGLTGTPSISGAVVTLTLASAIVETDTGVKVSYTKPDSGTANKLADSNGDEVDSFADQEVDITIAPRFVSAIAAGRLLVVTFDETLAAGGGAGVKRVQGVPDPRRRRRPAAGFADQPALHQRRRSDPAAGPAGGLHRRRRHRRLHQADRHRRQARRHRRQRDRQLQRPSRRQRRPARRPVGDAGALPHRQHHGLPGRDAAGAAAGHRRRRPERGRAGHRPLHRGRDSALRARARLAHQRIHPLRRRAHRQLQRQRAQRQLERRYHLDQRRSRQLPHHRHRQRHRHRWHRARRCHRGIHRHRALPTVPHQPLHTLQRRRPERRRPERGRPERGRRGRCRWRRRGWRGYPACVGF